MSEGNHWILNFEKLGIQKTPRNKRILNALIDDRNAIIFNGADDVIEMASAIKRYIIEYPPLPPIANELPAAFNIVDLGEEINVEQIREKVMIGYAPNGLSDLSQIIQSRAKVVIKGIEPFLAQGDFSPMGNGCEVMRLLVLAVRYGSGGILAINRANFWTDPEISPAYGRAYSTCHFMQEFFGAAFVAPKLID